MGDERGDDAAERRRADVYSSARIGAAAALTLVLVVLLVLDVVVPDYHVSPGILLPRSKAPNVVKVKLTPMAERTGLPALLPEDVSTEWAVARPTGVERAAAITSATGDPNVLVGRRLSRVRGPLIAAMIAGVQRSADETLIEYGVRKGAAARTAG